ncbi:MAG: ABC transporter permease [Clostridiales bacterium]|nr:ABC transporter permease [Clostridiales bacterium]
MILAVVLGITIYLAIGYVNYVDEYGHSSSGYTAAHELREKKNQWAGYIAEEKISAMLEENARINASEEYRSNDVRENEKAYSKKQGFEDIRDMVNHAFSSFREYDYYRADRVTGEEAGTMYQRRISNLEEWLNSEEVSDRYTPEEKDFLITKYKELDTPLYYEYADGWKALLEYASTIMMLTVLILGFLVSGIFSNEFQLKTDAVFFSSKLGRNKGVLSKIGAGFLIVTGMYWIVMMTYSGIMLLVLGADGAGCAIQTGMGGWKSFNNITYFEEYLLTVVGGYIGSLFMLSLSMFVSARFRSTVIAVTIPFILLFLPSFLSGISVLSEFLGLLPDQLLQIKMAVNYFNLYQIGGKIVGAIPIIMVLYLILICVLYPAMYHVYRKTEIK